MRKFIKRLLCKHVDKQFVRNLYGDQIIEAGYKRSEWRCVRCGTRVLEDQIPEPAAHQATKEPKT